MALVLDDQQTARVRAALAELQTLLGVKKVTQPTGTFKGYGAFIKDMPPDADLLAMGCVVSDRIVKRASDGFKAVIWDGADMPDGATLDHVIGGAAPPVVPPPPPQAAHYSELHAGAIPDDPTLLAMGFKLGDLRWRAPEIDSWEITPPVGGTPHSGTKPLGPIGTPLGTIPPVVQPPTPPPPPPVVVGPPPQPARAGLGFTLPAKTQKTLVKCTTCTGTRKDKPSVGYQGAISSFAGRFLDSTYVGDWQGPIRTLRAWQMKYDAVHDRIYMRLGSLFAAYDGASFVGRLLAGERPVEASTVNRPPSATAEKYLNPDRVFYPETESTWNQGRPDGQDFMPDFDYDDRGNVYLACRVLWGIIKDDFGKGGGAGLQAITQVLDASDGPGSITSVKTGDGRYFVIVGSGAGSSDVYDVTTPTAPVKTGSSRAIAASSSAKTTDQHWVAVIEGTNLEIFTPEALVTNGSPSKTLSAPAGAYRGVATDGTRFYSAIQSGSTTIISILTLSGGTWTEQQIPTGLTFTPGAIHYGNGHLSIRGDADFHVFRLSGTTAVDLDFAAFDGTAATRRYFSAFYSAAGVPPGFLAPEGINFFDSLVYRAGGKLYLIANLKGLGDVYEIQ